MPMLCPCNHYDTLGVPRDASHSEIKNAYRKKALREHPDKQRGRGTASRAAAATRMERINEAYGTLADPECRRRYNQQLSNPFGRHESHYAGASASRHYEPAYEPRVVTVTLGCTLEQLGGFTSVPVDLSSALGLPATAMVPPLRVFLPPGSRFGDRHRMHLQHLGIVLVIKPILETPHATFTRNGDDLEATVHLPAWHNRRWWPLRGPVRLRSICGGRVAVCAAGQFIPPGGMTCTLPGFGMPCRAEGMATDASSSPFACTRGNLVVRLDLQSLKETSLQYVRGVAAGLAAGLILRRLAHTTLRALLPTQRKQVLTLWTGPGPGIGRPFRIWGRGSALYVYKSVPA